MSNFKIYFLYHSGFIVELEHTILVFDYFQDPCDKMSEVLESGKTIYFLVSHVHHDHFNPGIKNFENKASGYFIHSDCRLPLRNTDHLHIMDVGDSYAGNGISVKMYGSTDAGGSYVVEAEGHTFFHAGDLNWWHWAGESDWENREARNAFFKELNRIKERKADIAFIPVDARQQVAREWGVKKYLERLDTDLLIPMHAFGQRWVPSYEFTWLYPDQKIWIPEEPGDVYKGNL